MSTTMTIPRVFAAILFASLTVFGCTEGDFVVREPSVSLSVSPLSASDSVAAFTPVGKFLQDDRPDREIAIADTRLPGAHSSEIAHRLGVEVRSIGSTSDVLSCEERWNCTFDSGITRVIESDSLTIEG